MCFIRRNNEKKMSKEYVVDSAKRRAAFLRGGRFLRVSQVSVESEVATEVSPSSFNLGVALFPCCRQRSEYRCKGFFPYI